MRENRDCWEAWSDAFQAAWNAETDESLPPAEVHYGPGMPADERFDHLPDIEGARVVELGCGGGQASVGFARRGAERVVGVDLAVRQLEHAERLARLYGVGDAVDLVAADVAALPVADDRFDLAFSSWAFQMVPDLAAAFAEAGRVLRPDGAFVFAVPHPVYELFDAETGDLERSYFDPTPERQSVGDVDPDLTVFHRRVGEIHRALVDAGFDVERLIEPGTDEPDDYRDRPGHDADLMATVPPTLVVRARRSPPV